LSYFDIDVPLVNEGLEIVMGNDFWQKDGHRDMHVCIVHSWYGHAELEVFEIAHHTLCFWGGDNAVEQ
jgi:hypothetical protein